MKSVIAINVIALSIALSACSTSEFGGKGGQVSTGDSKSKAASTANNNDSDKSADAANKGDTNNNGGVTAEDTAQTVEKDAAAKNELARRQDEAGGHVADDSERGCALPDDVRAKFYSPINQRGGDFGLQGWGGVGGSDRAAAPLLLHNVNVEKCPWRAELDSNQDYKYVVAYTTEKDGEKQSYVEPYGLTDPAQRANHAACLASAALTPDVVCHQFTRNADGTVSL